MPSAPDANDSEAPAPDDNAQAAPRASAWSNPPADKPTKVRFNANDRAGVARVLCESKPLVKGRCKCPSWAELDGIGLQIGTILTGHFSGPGRDEAIVETSGCETGAGSSMTDASRVLVRRTEAGWQRVFAEAGAIGNCLPFVSGRGRARLVCKTSGGRFGEYQNVFNLVAFDDDGEEVRQETAPLVSYTTHLLLPTFPAPSPLFGFQVTRFALRGAAEFEAGDDAALALDIVIRSDVKCTSAAECASFDATTKDLALTFDFKGERFELTQASRSAEATLDGREHFPRPHPNND